MMFLIPPMVRIFFPYRYFPRLQEISPRGIFRIAACLLAFSTWSPAASQTWTGAVDGDFATGGNWSGGSAPGNTTGTNNNDVVTFNNAVNTDITVDAGRTIGSIVFDLSTAGAFVFDGSQLKLTAGTPSIVLNSGVQFSQIFNNDLTTSKGATSFTNNSATARAKLLINGDFTGAEAIATTLTLSGTGNGEVNGAILDGATGGITNLSKSGNGTWVISGNNTYTGTTSITTGALSVSSISNNLGNATSAISIGSATLIYTGGGETATRSFNLAGTGGTSVITAAGTGALALAGNITSTSTGNKVLLLNGTNTGNNTVSGIISNSSASILTSLRKDGAGKWVLAGANTYTGSTQILGGNLTLDFSATTAPTDHIINSSSALLFGVSAGTATSGSLNIVGKSNIANVQSFDSAMVTIGVGAYHLNLNPTGIGSVTLNLGAIRTASSATTRVSGFSLDISLPSAAATVNTTTELLASGALPQAITINGTDFATLDAGKVVAFTGYTSNTSTTLGTTNQIVNMVTDTTLSANTTISGLRFNTAAAHSITVASNNLLSVNGGILVTAGVGANASTISGGMLGGTGGRDLLILQNNTSSALEISSTIVANSNGGGITKAGQGDLILSGLNSTPYSSYLNEGRTIVTSDSVAGFTITAGATAGSNTFTVSNTSGFWIGQRVNSSGGALGGNSSYNSIYVTAINSVTNTITLNVVTPAAYSGSTVDLVMSAGSAFGNGLLYDAVTASSAQVAAGATLQIGNGGTTGSLLDEQGVLNNGSVVFNRSNALAFASVISGIGSVTQAGSGTTTLNGAHTYSGSTLVNAGTLLVNGSAINSTAAVNAGGRLGGSGAVGGLVLNAGGTLAPGNSIGTLSTSNGDFVWNGQASGAFAQMKFELNPSSNSADLLNLGSGMLDRGTGGVFAFDFLGTGGAGFTYTLISFGSTDFTVDAFSYSNLAAGLAGEFVLNANTLQFVVTAIPEPSATALGGMALALMLWRNRRRNRPEHRSN